MTNYQISHKKLKLLPNLSQEKSLEEKYAVYDKNQTNLINQVKRWAYQKHPILDEASPGMTLAEFNGVGLKESDW